MCFVHTLAFILLGLSPLGAESKARLRSEPQKRTVFLAPFENQSKSRNFNYLRETIPDAFIRPLKKKHRFKILNRSRALRKARAEGVPTTGLSDTQRAVDLGRAVEADVVVVGYFVRKGKRIRIEARAIDVNAGRVSVEDSALIRTDATMFDSIDRLAERMSGPMAKKLLPLPKTPSLAIVTPITKEILQSANKMGEAQLAQKVGITPITKVDTTEAIISPPKPEIIQEIKPERKAETKPELKPDEKTLNAPEKKETVKGAESETTKPAEIKNTAAPVEVRPPPAPQRIIFLEAGLSFLQPWGPTDSGITYNLKYPLAEFNPGLAVSLVFQDKIPRWSYLTYLDGFQYFASLDYSLHNASLAIMSQSGRLLVGREPLQLQHFGITVGLSRTWDVWRFGLTPYAGAALGYASLKATGSHLLFAGVLPGADFGCRLRIYVWRLAEIGLDIRAGIRYLSEENSFLDYRVLLSGGVRL